MEKIFVCSDSMLAEYTAIETTSKNDSMPIFICKVLKIKAHPGVNSQNILEEVQDIEDKYERGELLCGIKNFPCLTTTITEYDDIVVALSYQAFKKLADTIWERNPGKLKRECYKCLAEELVYHRDNK